MTAERFLPNLLLDGFYAVSLCVAAMFFLATQRATSARWSAGLRRIPEAFFVSMPIFVLLMIPLIAIPGARTTLFVWSRPDAFAHAPAIAGKVQYLRAPFVFARMAVVAVVWILFARAFRRTSLAQDRMAGTRLQLHQRLNRLGSGFIVAFALTITLAAYDWLAALDPSWASTMFAVYVFAGVFESGIAAITLGTVALASREPLKKAVTEKQLHDLGKLMFAFSIFWAYIWVCQYLLIWYGNIPEETIFYRVRIEGGFRLISIVLAVGHFGLPFFFLMPRQVKRNAATLVAAALWILAMHFVDVYWLVMPSVPGLGARPGLVDVAALMAVGGVFLAAFGWLVVKSPLVPAFDPQLQESLAFENV
jgi:hypothetical protein